MTEIAKKVLLLIGTSRGADRNMLRGISRRFQLEPGWKMIVEPPFYTSTSRHWKDYRKKSIEKIIKDSGAQGVIGYLPNPEKLTYDKILNSSLPFVAIPVDNLVPGTPNLISNEIETGQMAADYFIKLGFKNFGFCGLPNMYWSHKRMEGFISRLNARGFQVSRYPPEKTKAHRSWEKEYELMAAWLKTLSLPIGILAFNDDRARQLINACISSGLHVPDQVSVLGVDNDELMCRMSVPSISSVSLTFEKAGYEMARIIQEMIDNNNVSENITIQPIRVHVRQSTDILKVDDQQVKQALRFIKENAMRGIQVADVVRAVATTRRNLERRFQAAVKSSIMSQINSVRSNMIVKMLTETNDSISEIANKLGFSDEHHISRWFKKQTGSTPLAYRRKHTHKN